MRKKELKKTEGRRRRRRRRQQKWTEEGTVLLVFKNAAKVKAFLKASPVDEGDPGAERVRLRVKAKDILVIHMGRLQKVKAEGWRCHLHARVHS